MLTGSLARGMGTPHHPAQRRALESRRRGLGNEWGMTAMRGTFPIAWAAGALAAAAPALALPAAAGTWRAGEDRGQPTIVFGPEEDPESTEFVATCGRLPGVVEVMLMRSHDEVAPGQSVSLWFEPPEPALELRGVTIPNELDGTPTVVALMPAAHPALAALAEASEEALILSVDGVITIEIPREGGAAAWAAFTAACAGR